MIREITPRKARILVADDEEFNRLLLDRILSKEYEIDFAVNGREVLEKIEQFEYDVALIDVMMPVMTGIEALKEIRRTFDLTTLPVILISAVTDTKTIVEGIDVGANDYITKPLDAMVVLARLRTQLTLKQLMDERKVVTNALEEANEMKLQMMQIASHDLKTPLSNLSLLMRLIGDNSDGNKKIAKYLRTVKTVIKNMVQIIEDFLSSQIFTLPEITEISTLNILSEIMKEYEISAINKNIKISLDADDDVLIAADEIRIKQVISNLLSNAVKYSPPGGTVTVRAMQQESTWRLEVQDSGLGIPESEQEYLFQAFSKDYISTKPTAGEASTGLGLWIASRMMHAQHGTIGMDSPESGGCCFWIEIPLADHSGVVAV